MATKEPPVDAAALATQHLAVGLAADVERLNALDDVWTSYLRGEPEPATVERDLPDLRGLVDDMRSAMMRVRGGSVQLRHVIQDLNIDLDAQLRVAIESSPVGETLMQMLPDGPIAPQVIDACSIVEEEVPSEIDALLGKLERLVRDGYSPGDIGGRLKCAILLVGAGASLVGLGLALVAPPAGVVVGAAGILMSTVAAANGWNCKRAGDIATAPS